jgi:hypothetical protein
MHLTRKEVQNDLYGYIKNRQVPPFLTGVISLLEDLNDE